MQFSYGQHKCAACIGSDGSSANHRPRRRIEPYTLVWSRRAERRFATYSAFTTAQRGDCDLFSRQGATMKILMVMTSHDQLGNTGRKTGFWLEELAAPYYVFKDSGADITLASQRAAVHRSTQRATSRNSAPG